MNEHAQRSDTRRVFDGTLACLVIVRLVGVFLYGHPENFGELRPVGHVVTLVDDPRRGLCQYPHIVLVPDKEQVGVFIPRGSRDVRLVA